TLRLPIVRDRELVDGDVLEVVRFDVADKPAERVGIRFEAVDLAQSANALTREQSVLPDVCADVEDYVSGFDSLLEEVYGLGFVAPVRAYAAANRIVPRHSDLEPVSERRPPRDAIAKPRAQGVRDPVVGQGAPDQKRPFHPGRRAKLAKRRHLSKEGEQEICLRYTFPLRSSRFLTYGPFDRYAGFTMRGQRLYRNVERIGDVPGKHLISRKDKTLPRFIRDDLRDRPIKGSG